MALSSGTENAPLNGPRNEPTVEYETPFFENWMSAVHEVSSRRTSPLTDPPT